MCFISDHRGRSILLICFVRFSCSDTYVDCCVYLFGFREIASGTVPDPGSLKGNDTTMLNVGLKVPHSVLLSLAKDIGADWDIDYELGIDFVFDLPVFGNITIPVSSKGEIKLPTFSDLWTK